MGNEIEIREFVNQRAKQFGFDLESQRPKIQEQLLQIEEYLQRLMSEQEQVAKKIKELSKVNINSVSSGANVQRSTIYNNSNTLQVYIEERCKEIEKEDILNANKINKMKSKDEELMDVFEGLQQQVVDNFELILQIKDLETENKTLTSLNESKQKEIHRLEQENRVLRSQLSRQAKDRIVSIQSKSNQ